MFDSTTPLNTSHPFEPSAPQSSRIERLKAELQSKYEHLHPRFYPDSICMQAKISISVLPGQSLLIDPGLYADVLQHENFQAEYFKHRLPNKSGVKDSQQFVLNNEAISSIGHRFVLKATFGPSFISFWFRNESTDDRLDIPLCYALEIINKLHDRLNRVSTQRHLSEITGDIQQHENNINVLKKTADSQ